MTEILLSVTNREIQQICKEELQRYINKNKGIVIRHYGVETLYTSKHLKTKNCLFSPL